MIRAMVALWYWTWWRFVLMTADPCHPSYIHAQWRLFQEAQTIKGFLNGD